MPGKQNTAPVSPDKNPDIVDAVKSGNEVRIAGTVQGQRTEFIDLHADLGGIMDEMSESFAEVGVDKNTQRTAVKGKLQETADVAIGVFESFHEVFAAMEKLIGDGEGGADPQACVNTLLGKFEKKGGLPKMVADNADCRKKIEAAFIQPVWSGDAAKGAIAGILKAAEVPNAEESASIFVGQLGALHSAYQLVAAKENKDAINHAGGRKSVLKFMSGKTADRKTIDSARTKTDAKEMVAGLGEAGLTDKDSVTEVVVDFQRVTFATPKDAKATAIAQQLLNRTYGIGVTEVVKRDKFMTKEQLKLCETVRVRRTIKAKGDAAPKTVDLEIPVTKQGKLKSTKAIRDSLGLSKAQMTKLQSDPQAKDIKGKAILQFCIPGKFGIPEIADVDDNESDSDDVDSEDVE